MYAVACTVDILMLTLPTHTYMYISTELMELPLLKNLFLKFRLFIYVDVQSMTTVSELSCLS